MFKITVKFITLGCKTNFYESEAMAELFLNRGYELAEDGSADIYVINTCSVTGTGAQKSRQHIRRARHENPAAIVAVCGCYSQTEPEAAAAIAEADVIIGTANRRSIVDLVERAQKGERVVEVSDISKTCEFEELPSAERRSRTRAVVKIQDGCDNFCTYCIIPYARGRVRSRKIENIADEARSLAESGYREIVLTGIHIGSYGKDFGGEPSLIDVIETVCRTEGIERVRIGSLEPVAVTRSFAERAAALKNLCPQFHLSLQSGCDETLKRMNRRYTTDEYRAAVELLRKSFSDAAITTDLMVGFAGETDEEFEKSLEFVKEINFAQMHIFKYSVRRGTAAAKMPCQIPEQIKNERSAKMLSAAKQMRNEFCKKYIGQTVEILAETQRENHIYHGCTANYTDVAAHSDKDIRGKIVKVKIEAFENDMLRGDVI